MNYGKGPKGNSVPLAVDSQGRLILSTWYLRLWDWLLAKLEKRALDVVGLRLTE